MWIFLNSIRYQYVMCWVFQNFWILEVGWKVSLITYLSFRKPAGKRRFGAALVCSSQNLLCCQPPPCLCLGPALPGCLPIHRPINSPATLFVQVHKHHHSDKVNSLGHFQYFVCSSIWHCMQLQLSLYFPKAGQLKQLKVRMPMWERAMATSQA